MLFSERLEAADRRPSGFDYLRLILASAVIVSHSTNVVSGIEVAKALFFSFWRIPLIVILPAFFALSGFLVAGSLSRCPSLLGFVGLRVLRLVPALAVEVFLSALLIGPLLTAFTMHDYFSSPAFAAYFLNIVGIIHFTLPGVFLTNPWPEIVNTQLWTIPFELEAYMVLTLLALAGIARKRAWFLAAAVLMQTGAALYRFTHPEPLPLLVGGRLLVLCFIFGVTAYFYRDRIRSNAGIAIASGILLAVLFYIPGGEYFIGAPITYLTIYIGLFNPKRIRFFLSGDYSYGMYLYGFPIQQCLVALIPSLSVGGNAVLALAIAFIIAHFSWHLVEKRAMALKKPLHGLERAGLSQISQTPLGRRVARLLAAGA